jgi:PhnB protein
LSSPHPDVRRRGGRLKSFRSSPPGLYHAATAAASSTHHVRNRRFSLPDGVERLVKKRRRSSAALEVPHGRTYSIRKAASMAKAIPDGYHSVTPYLVVDGAAKGLDFYKRAFGAVELFRMDGPDGKIAHAEMKIGDSPIMLADEHPEMGFRSPTSFGGTAVGLMIYVQDCDKVYNQAVAAGAKVHKPLVDQFYGDRSGSLTDPFGHHWTVATHKEDVSPEEMDRRMKAMSVA